MHRPASIVNHLTFALAATPLRGADYFTPLHPTIRGWSGLIHLAFYHAVLGASPEIKSILVCGVYHGLDLHLIANAAAQAGREIRLVGVDLFSAGPLPDWRPEDRAKSWEEAHGIPPPSLSLARHACPTAEIVQANSVDYLRAHASEFDFIYLDTSHDYDQVHAEISACLADGAPRLLAGDDYANLAGHSWGVDRACAELLPDHLVVFNRIWLAQTPRRA